MDLRTFLESAETLLSELEPSMRPSRVRSIGLSFRHGEEGLGLNELVSTLVRNRTPVTPAQRDALRVLIQYFVAVDDEALRDLPYVSDRSIDRLAVVAP